MSLKEDVPLPTHKSANKSPIVNIEEVPIRVNPSNTYQYDSYDTYEEPSIPKQKANKSQNKKKIIKLSNDTKS